MIVIDTKRCSYKSQSIAENTDAALAHLQKMDISVLFRLYLKIILMADSFILTLKQNSSITIKLVYQGLDFPKYEIIYLES
jgi:hypothetical protein